MNRLLSLAKGKCPRCEEGEVFESKGSILTLKMPVMHEECGHCGHHFEKEPGFFLGAMYVSYALTIAESVTVYVLAYNLITKSVLILPLIFSVVIPLSFVNYRYSRMVWMYSFTQKETQRG